MLGRRRSSESGAVAIEAALIMPILVLLVFGMIEFGFAMKDWLAVSSSVRAGARMASAEPRQTSFADDAAKQVANEALDLDPTSIVELWVYKAKSNGYPVGDTTDNFSACTACVKYTYDTTSKAFVHNGVATWVATDQNACVKDAAHDAVGVYLRTNRKALTHLFFDHLNIYDKAVLNLEPITSTAACK